jgi:hypothetical protein
MNREAKALHGQLVDLGFVLVRSKRHLVYRHEAGGPPVAAPKTASDWRASKNVLAKARRVARELEAARP